MSAFDFTQIHREFPENLLQKTYIWIWNADKIPPHIGISAGKEYYSLTYRKSEQLLTASMLKKAKRSAVPLVLVEIPSEIIKQDLNTVFKSYQRAMNGITCLYPIREALSLGSEINQLTDLLKHLQSEKLIRNVSGANLPEAYKGIPGYSMEDILKRIEYLNGEPKK
ncbi:hypothetical protein D3C87_309810 [compost metagenome]